MQLAPVAPRPPRVPLVGAYVPTVARLVAAMARRDGLFHHAGRYLANAGDAALVRRRAAEQLHASALRGAPTAIAEVRALMHPAVPVPTCVWCRRAIGAATLPETLGGRAIHPACLLAFDVMMADARVTRGEG